MGKGIQSYDTKKWHSGCPGVEVVDIGGFAWLYCPVCRVFANLQAVSDRHQSVAESAAFQPSAYAQAAIERGEIKLG